MSQKFSYSRSAIFSYSILSTLFLALATFLHGAESPPPFELKWGTYGSGDGQFDLPNSMAVDSSGNVYVSDFNHRIQKFDSSGNFLLKWGRNGGDGTSGNLDGELNGPIGVAVDGSGNVYVADAGNNRIQKFSGPTSQSPPTFALKWGTEGSGDGQFITPQGVAVDGSGNVYVADTANNRIQKFDSSGNFLLKWGTNGTGDGQFNLPEGVAVDGSGNVYVADTDNHRIQKFDSSGNFLLKWGANSSNDGGFSDPVGVVVDGSGNVYVLDAVHTRIQKFDSSGNFLLKWGGGPLAATMGSLLLHKV